MVDPRKNKGSGNGNEKDSEKVNKDKVKSEGSEGSASFQEEDLQDYQDVLDQMREELGEITESKKERYGGYTFEAEDDLHEDERVIEYNKLTDEMDRRKIQENMADKV
mgnify:FL=1